MALPVCLTDTIGIEQCDPGAANAPLHLLSELEGLSVGSIAATADGDKWASAKEAVAAIVPIGVGKTLFRLKNLLAQRGAFMQKEIDTGEFCCFTTNAQVGLHSGDQGVQIQRNKLLQPAAQPIRLNWVTLKSPNDTVNIPLKVKNEAGTVLWEVAVATLPANTELQIPVGVEFNENKIRVVVEGVNMQGYYAGCGKGEVCCGELPYSSPASVQRSAFFVNGIENGAVGGFKSPGITVNVSLPCNDSLFCKYREVLAPAFLLDTGIQVLREWQASNRMNVFALKKEWVEKTLPVWEKEAIEKTEAVVPAIFDDMLKCFPRCFDCKQPVGYIAALP